MFTNRVIAEFKKVVGFKNWYAPIEIPALDAALTVSESGQYVQDYHRLVRLDYINALIRSNNTLNNYLEEARTTAINKVLSDFTLAKQLTNHGKAIATNDIIYQNVVRGSSIVNAGQFVGIEFRLKEGIGLKAVLNRIGLYFSQAESINLYLFNSLQPQVVQIISYNNVTANSFQWIDANLSLEADVGTQIPPNVDTTGGVWYLGYYQDDLTGQAWKYEILNWVHGYCRSCDNGVADNKYKSISKYLKMRPFYIPSSAVPTHGEMFDVANIRYDDTNNWGFNFNISITCDLSQFLIDNRREFKNAIGEYICDIIINDYIYSSEKSGLEQQVKDMAFEVINGNAQTKIETFESRKKRAIKALDFDTGNVNNSPCLPCARGGIS